MSSTLHAIFWTTSFVSLPSNQRSRIQKVQPVINTRLTIYDSRHLVVNSHHLVVDSRHLVVDDLSEPQGLRSCHTSLFLRQLIQSFQSIFQLLLPNKLLQILLYTPIS